MPKLKKRPPRDYHEDMRIKPYATEETTGEELYERFRRGVKALFPNDPPPRRGSPAPQK